MANASQIWIQQTAKISWFALSTMSKSINEKCDRLKKEYDACFTKWFADKFLKGDARQECHELYQDYRQCVLVRSSQCKEIFAVLSKKVRASESFVAS
jgi:TRIAP1/MDM35 family protein